MRYNIALLALEAKPFIDEAQRMFGAYHQGYVLSSKSYPHVTLCQFECAEEEKLEKVKAALQKITEPLPPVQFTGISFLQKDPATPHLYWAQISVAREDALIDLQAKMVHMVQELGCKPLTKPGNLYGPHLTLAFTELPETLERWPDELFADTKFKLTLGRADHLGQYTEVLMG